MYQNRDVLLHIFHANYVKANMRKGSWHLNNQNKSKRPRFFEYFYSIFRLFLLSDELWVIFFQLSSSLTPGDLIFLWFLLLSRIFFAFQVQSPLKGRCASGNKIHKIMANDCYYVTDFITDLFPGYFLCKSLMEFDEMMI